jgi:putative nucleotidyltransferase with HDIG domain
MLESSRIGFNAKNTFSKQTALTEIVIAAGAAAVALALTRQALAAEYAWLAMIALALCVAPLSTITIPGIKASVTLGDVVTFSCAALFGPSAAVIAAVADGTVTSLRITKNYRKFFYNVGTGAVSMAIAGFATTAAFPGFGVRDSFISPVKLAAAVALLTGCYFVISTSLIGAYISFSTKDSFLKVWREHFLWTSVSYLASGVSSFAACFLIARFGYYTFLVPIGVMVMALFFYRTYFNKVEGAYQRADQMEELNFRTVETLVTAIGAVGFATKVNIRRVERLVAELGAAAGCSEDQMKALRLAAVLHDIGNIAVPQDILEKPGALTSEEFDKIKMHTKAGAKMAESMGFPYPVAEIIRYHHERYDGTGYPERLRGVEIPLGARVLAIVDYYNALTVDRPYRAKLCRKDAIDMMKALSDKAFDPLVLGKFLEIVGMADKEACKQQSEAVQVDDLWIELFSQRSAWQVAGRDLAASQPLQPFSCA